MPGGYADGIDSFPLCALNFALVPLFALCPRDAMSRCTITSKGRGRSISTIVMSGIYLWFEVGECVNGVGELISERGGYHFDMSNVGCVEEEKNKGR